MEFSNSCCVCKFTVYCSRSMLMSMMASMSMSMSMSMTDGQIEVFDFSCP